MRVLNNRKREHCTESPNFLRALRALLGGEPQQSQSGHCIVVCIVSKFQDDLACLFFGPC